MKFLHQPWVRVLAVVTFLVLLAVPPGIPLRVIVLACGALIWTLLEARSVRPLGFRRRGVRSTLLWGVGIFVILTVVGEVVQPLVENLLDMKPDYSGYGALAGNGRAALQLFAFALISAAICEEILFRGFLLHQLSALMGDGTAARWTAILGGAAVFGLAHIIQGPLGVLTTGLAGILFGWAWYRTDRNLWALILAHALTDAYGIGMLYLGRYV